MIQSSSPICRPNTVPPSPLPGELAAQTEEPVTLRRKDSGFHGIWYANQPSANEYVYKYSGGLGTYSAKHQPFAVYCAEVRKTFFCYGGTTRQCDRQPSQGGMELLHIVSYFDHACGAVARPTIVLNKQTEDAHDNPVISVDTTGYIWIFSTSHGRDRPSYIHRSCQPYDIDHFETVAAVHREGAGWVPFDNFSYMQVWHRPGEGFMNFLTRYDDPALRTIGFISSRDGRQWSQWTRLAAICEGHYQVSAVTREKAVTAFNFHPPSPPDDSGLNWRSNLYYLETPDSGVTWRTASGEPVSVPLTEIDNAAMVHDFYSRGLNVYLKDICFDPSGNPVVLFLTSGGYQAGPENQPRTWMTARWNGNNWDIHPAFTSDSNYDMGSLYIQAGDCWRIIAPTSRGAQPYNPGGEVVMWISADRGRTWTLVQELTRNSRYNHTYVRRPVNAHPDFYAFWADGHGRQPSRSRLYFCTRRGDVFMLPEQIDSDMAEPVQIP